MVIHRVEQYTLRVILKHYTDYSRTHVSYIRLYLAMELILLKNFSN